MQSAPHELGNLKTPLDHNRPLLDSELQTDNSATRPSGNTTPVSYPRSQPKWTLLPWKLQILSWIGSLLFFIATIVVLRVLDGRPLPNTKIGITPNAIIGLLATFTELLLIVPVNSAVGQLKWLRALQKRPMDDFRTIDEASRGPWGSLLLLTRRTGGATASFGALVTILALGISTFSQQALRYDTIYPHSDDAWIPVAQFMNGSGGVAPLGDGAATTGFDAELLTAPYAAFYTRNGTTLTATAHCGTGNCTWESYETLSVCSTCQDLSSQLKRTHIDADQYVGATDHYTLPNGFSLLGRPRNSDRTSILNITATLNTEDAKHERTWDSIAFQNKGSKLLNVFGIGPSPGKIPKEPDANDTKNGMAEFFGPPVAYECLLQFCVRNMHAVFINGTLKETVISTWTDQNQPPPDTVRVPRPPITLRPPGSSTAFVVESRGLVVTQSWLRQLLINNATKATLSAEYIRESLPTFTSDIAQSFFLAMNTSTTGFPDLIDKLAQSLSLSLRDIPYQPPPVVGRAFTIGNHAVVIWLWLVLPIIELIGSLVFLVAVMLETNKAGLVPWTNNPLAYFFHGFDERPFHGDVCKSQRAMEQEARGLLVEFQTHEDGGRLVVVDKTV